MLKNPFFSFLTLLELLLLPLHAQSSESPGVKVRALLLVPGGPTIDLYAIAAETGKETGPILVGARGISDPLDPGARVFSFAMADPSTESGRRPVATISLPAIGNDFIILLEPAGNQFKPHLVSGQAPRFGNSSTMFFNATDHSIGASLGESRILIPPRKPVVAEAPPRGEQPWYQVAFYEPQEDGSPRVFSNTRWPYRNASRSYVFFYRSEPSGRISYQAVDETLQPAAD